MIVTRPLYAGFREHDGEFRPAAHEAIVSVETFNQAQQVFYSAAYRKLNASKRIRLPQRSDGKQEALREALRCVGGEVLLMQCECAVALDGKTMRSSRRSDGGQACLVSGCEQSTGAVVDTVMVKRGESELTAGREAVKKLIRKHRQVSVITGDALYADRVLAGFIEKSGRDYVLKVKKINLNSWRT